ncbi:hypothetical protein [Fulvivirga sp.]|uniref:hypothetical protein n=1 Tax=Fulvivirga sp. TaxID=1931237 RepID=UPI0032EDBA78
MRPLNSKTRTIIALTVAGIFLFSFQYHSEEISKAPVWPVEVFSLKEEALKVFQTKCNICHQKRNPRKVFTESNMADYAAKIYEQVFVKKRMPKGNKIQLTESEVSTLKKWITTTNSI